MWKTRWKRRLLRCAVFVRRHPYLFALLGLASGIGSFILVDRQEGMASFLAAFMLAGWVLLLVEKPLRRLLSRLAGVAIPSPVVSFTTQVVHQESLFFVLPFLVLTTTLNSSQLLFTGLIALAAAVSVWDPLYHGWLAQRRWIYLAFHALAMFVLLLTALPIIFHLRTPDTYAIAAGLSLLFAFPSLLDAIPLRSILGIGKLMALITLLAGGAWLARPAVPPVTFWLTDRTMTLELDTEERRPGTPMESFCQADLENRRVYAFTAVRAPRGLREKIWHQWIHEGQSYDKLPVDISGGREQGYRLWTYKETFPSEARGRWEVRVLTSSGQMIGKLRFTVDC